MSDSLWRDERAIEGLPIRLVIALVVGVACLSVMMSTISGIETLQVTEVDVEPHPEVTDPGTQDVVVTVVDSKGSPVSGATVVAKSGTATLASVTTGETDGAGNVTLSLSPSLGPNQQDGTVVFEVKPPAGSNYEDARSNTDMLVVESP
ncbi:carboxypeptidase regulatory-like domain-containing protein [Haloarcula sp. S1AR25-5A]|uniref:Carboxypeptidase regulatory-like domain-containing protein n=1 Tax=Haloarcula terrestris TaxID=2950533 RepID=A0AAE4JH87_9EURY|nr:carboxypeptidase regulatory-like domain-containing protein [Haloarcula terrestris]MDS0219876.1 carboxypeptidase regulatory-like domain-containing protein [Haloarcula terrestris]